MKKLLLAMFLLVAACDKPKPPPEKVVVKEVLVPTPVPAPTNPFDKAPPAPPVPVHAPFVPPQWQQVGEFKMNDNWSIWTWRDVANHNTCYIYNVMPDGKFGMSCVKE